MCGIIGYVGDKPAAPVLIKALGFLTSRGYDSYGIATYNHLSQTTHIHKSLDKVPIRPSKSLLDSLPGSSGIGHNRWSQTGEVSIQNAHPVAFGGILCVHNGIISNYKEILPDATVDSQAIPTLLSQYKELPLIKLHEVIFDKMKGTWAFLALQHGQISGSVNGLPLVVSECGQYIASDVMGFPKEVKKYYRLPDKSTFIVIDNKIWLFDGEYKLINELPLIIRGKIYSPNKGRCKFFTEKELKEQYRLGYHFKNDINLPDYPEITLFGCGTSYNAALFGQKIIESKGFAAHAEYATQLSDRLINKDGLFIALSQSGETADVLYAVRNLKERSVSNILAITNGEHSSLVNECKSKLLLSVGPELAVAATKSYSAQCFALMSLVDNNYKDAVDLFKKQCKVLIETSSTIANIAKEISHFSHILCLAQNWEWMSAKELALKLKEIAYKFSEAMISSELPHGSLAICTAEVLSIFLMGHNEGKNERVLENMSEIFSRRGQILTVCLPRDRKLVEEYSKWIIEIPEQESESVHSLLVNVVGQLLSYYIAIEEGLPIDNPRNLCKTVAV